MISLENQVVIITGTSSGIGRATAVEFAKAGAQVVSVARRAELLTELEKELAQFGKPVLSVPADLTKDEDQEKLVETVLQAYGRVDVLVNNAGLSIGGPFAEQDPAIVRQMVSLNVYAPLRLTQLVLPAMLKRKQGQIVNVASVAGIAYSPGQCTYAPTRAAIVAFSKGLRRELAGTGVRVSYVLPGWTATAMLEKMPLEKMRANGLLPPFTRVDPPEVPARAILEVVQRQRPAIQLGGLGFVMADFSERLSPLLTDWLMGLLFEKEKLLHGMKDLGA